MQVKKLQVAIGAALAALCNAAVAALPNPLPAPDLEVYIGGASAVRGNIARQMNKWCVADDTDTTGATPRLEFRLTGGAGGAGEADFRAYYCTFKNTNDVQNANLRGKRVLIRHSVSVSTALGGSILGVLPLYRSGSTPLGLTFVQASLSNTATACPQSGTDPDFGSAKIYRCAASETKGPEDVQFIGISDVEPTLFKGGNLPNNPAIAALWKTEPGALAGDVPVSQVNVTRAFVQAFGIILSKNLTDGTLGSISNLTQAQVSSILNGSEFTWDRFGGPAAPIKVCTRTRGSGTKAVFNALALANPCGADVPAAEPGGAIDVVENDTTSNLTTCMNTANTNGEAALGIISAENNTEGAGWRYVNIDGVQIHDNTGSNALDGNAGDRTREDNVINGKWPYQVESTIQWRSGASKGNLAGLPLDFGNMLVTALGDSANNLSTLPGIVSLSSAGVSPRAENSGAANYSRGGNSCAPLLYQP